MLMSVPSERHMRWRLHLADYIFEMRYKKGVLKTQADAFSKLSSGAHTTEHESVDVVENSDGADEN